MHGSLHDHKRMQSNLRCGPRGVPRRSNRMHRTTRCGNGQIHYQSDRPVVTGQQVLTQLNSFSNYSLFAKTYYLSLLLGVGHRLLLKLKHCLSQYRRINSIAYNNCIIYYFFNKCLIYFLTINIYVKILVIRHVTFSPTWVIDKSTNRQLEYFFFCQNLKNSTN